MANILNNTTSLQQMLEVLQTKAVPSGGTDTSDATATANEILSGKTAYVGGEKITGTIPTKTVNDLTASGAIVTVPSGYYVSEATKSVATTTQATPTISIGTNGLITATATQSEGYVPSGTQSATSQLAFQPAKTITPTTTSQIAVSSGYYTGGDITVQGDANLVAENIVSGKSIFGVTGTASVGGGDTGVEDGLITRNIVGSYENSRVMIVGSGAFCSCSRLTTVDFPNVWKIYFSAFYGCSNLTSVNFPTVREIENGAFAGCGSLTTVNFPATTSIGGSAFARCSNLTDISFPVAKSINGYAFTGCSNLTTVSFSMVTNIGDAAFQNCSSLTIASFPMATTIYNSTFFGCSNLITISFPEATYIGSCAFQKCNSLTSVDFPKVTTMQNYAFSGCSNLTIASFPVATTIGSCAFIECSSLTSVDFPMVTTISSGAFVNCANLTTISLPVATYIGSRAFSRCYNLKSLYLTNSSICSLNRSDAFASTPIGGYSASAGTYGSIFVPASLVDTYKSAYNWSYFADRFVGIE